MKNLINKNKDIKSFLKIDILKLKKKLMQIPAMSTA